MKKYTHLLLQAGLILSVFQGCVNYPEEHLYIENDRIKLGFDKNTGELVVFRDLLNQHELLNQDLVSGLPWEISIKKPEGTFQIDKSVPSVFSYSNPDPLTLHLMWKDFKSIKNKDFEITARVTIDRVKALSYWNISIDGIKGDQIAGVTFPRIEGIKDLGEEKMAVPTWMGQLIDKPRIMLSESNRKRWDWSYPGSLSSQVVFLYDSENTGFYASCNDSLSYVKNFSFALDSLNTFVYEMTNYPALDSTLGSYSPPYEAVIGSFKGDWINAAELYREWALKQRWAAESRFKKGLTPSWLENTALWIWNRGESDNVLKPAVELKQRLGLPVSVLWHWWHNCSYDDNFPEYMPPREGGESFINAVSLAQDEGVNCHVYMNALQWGDASEAWSTGKVGPYTVKDIDGNMRSHVYNNFTGNALINMCVGTEFWKDYYSSLCDTAVNIYQINGVYMDQTCLSRMCYDTTHEHEIGGGNYWVQNSRKLIDRVRSNDYGDKQPIFTGEGSSENWLPDLDAFLTLQASRERYAGVGGIETIPFFQAVYHQYGITYGSYSSLVSPPYDELWPREYAPDETEELLDEVFNKQFLMEQARSFVWGMQPAIANYHSFLASERENEIDYLLNIARLRYKGLKYLLYGKFLRTPLIETPREEIDISRLSIYAGRRGETVTRFKKTVPLLYSGAWKADDKSVGIVMASISDNPIPVDIKFNASDYGLGNKGSIYIVSNDGRKLLTSYDKESIHINILLEPRGLKILELIPSGNESL